MKRFVAIYLGSAKAQASWQALDERTRKDREKSGMAAWKKWAEEHSASIIGDGSPLGRTKRIGPNGIEDTRNQIAAYTVVQAESHEAAARLFVNHPHFMIFPGDSVEIMECLPIPEI